MGKAKKNTPKPRERGKAAAAGGETWGGETWDEWQQSCHILRVPRIRESIFDRMDRRLARIDQRLAESAAVPAPLPNPPAARVRRLSGKECIRDVFEPRRDELSAMTITDAAKVLAEASNLKVGSCANLLRATGAWKKQPRGQLNLPRPRSRANSAGFESGGFPKRFG